MSLISHHCCCVHLQYFGGQVVIGLKAAAAEMCGVLLAGQPFPKPPPLGATPPNSCWGELEDGAGPGVD